MKHKYLKAVFVLSLVFLLAAFQSEPSAKSSPGYPDARFLVFSDPHYYSPSLGTTGEAFEKYLDNDRKLLKESAEILGSVFSRIENSLADFIIIPGDLTKDGSLKSHTEFAEYLEKIENTGKSVFVIPGNHDLLNPESYSYSGEKKHIEKTVDPAIFKSIYENYGYGEALYQDPSSLSYIAEPEEGLWLFALDACRYSENQEGSHPVTGGRFNPETLKWIENMLYLAAHTHKSVIGMMHHGILEHYKKQSKFFGEYVVDDFREISELFAMNGMRMVFTGHYHAQDIAFKQFADNSFLFDIETGSLVTYPCPVREIRIMDNQAKIKSIFIENTTSHGGAFSSYAKEFVWSGIEKIAMKALIDFNLKEEEAASLSGQVADAFVAHYQGDESTPDKAFNLEGVSLKGRFLIGFRKKLVWNLWNDSYPADNNICIDLSSGKILMESVAREQ